MRARFKRPRAYRFVAAFPKSDTGKVLKTALRKQLQDEAAKTEPLGFPPLRRATLGANGRQPATAPLRGGRSAP